MIPEYGPIHMFDMNEIMCDNPKCLANTERLLVLIGVIGQNHLCLARDFYEHASYLSPEQRHEQLVKIERQREILEAVIDDVENPKDHRAPQTPAT